MEAASPLKRRALSSLDANAHLPASSSSPKQLATTSKSTVGAAAMSSPLKSSQAGTVLRKRAAEDDATVSSPAEKKSCVVERDEDTRSRTHSPDTSSVFDTSTEDASWATTTTEPDAVERVAVRPRGLTREQAREKAEILRLRLGLASYKVRTGQTSLSLSDLQPKPLPRRVVRIQSPDSTQNLPRQQQQPQEQQQQQQQQTGQSPTEENEDEEEQQEDDGESSAAAEDRPSALPSPVSHAVDDGRLTSNVLRGGAANGLLSLAMGNTTSP